MGEVTGHVTWVTGGICGSQTPMEAPGSVPGVLEPPPKLRAALHTRCRRGWSREGRAVCASGPGAPEPPLREGGRLGRRIKCVSLLSPDLPASAGPAVPRPLCPSRSPLGWELGRAGADRPASDYPSLVRLPAVAPPRKVAGGRHTGCVRSVAAAGRVETRWERSSSGGRVSRVSPLKAPAELKWTPTAAAFRTL